MDTVQQNTDLRAATKTEARFKVRGFLADLDECEDPVRDHSMTAYAYAGNEPVAHSDPTGLFRTGDILCRKRPGIPTWEDVSIVVRDDNGPANTAFNGKVHVATFARLKEPRPSNPDCPKGLKSIGPAGSKNDQYAAHSVVKKISLPAWQRFARTRDPETIRRRWDEWNECYGKPFQCMDFVDYLSRGKKQNPNNPFAGGLNMVDLCNQ